MEFIADVAGKKASAHGVKGWQLLGAIEICGGSEQLAVQLNQNEDCLFLITEGVAIIVHDLGEVVPLQCFGHCWWSADEQSQWWFPCVGHGLIVLPQEAVQTFPSLLKFNTCSSRSKSLATSHLMLSISFRSWPSYRTPFFIFQHFSVQHSRPRVRELTFHPGACMTNYEHVIYMMNSPFDGWHMVVTLVWWNKNRDFCPNSTMKILWLTTIVSPISLEFKMLQEGFALMQITIAHTT